MIEVVFFGLLAGTLASGLSLVLLLVALGAAAYLGFTAFTATLRLGPGPVAESGTGAALRALGRRWSPRAGVIATLATVGLATAGLRLHDAASSAGGVLFTVAVALTASTAAGAWSAALWLAAWRSFATLADRSAARRMLEDGARFAAAREIEAKSALFRAGDDLRAEVAQAEAALVQLGGALADLERIGAGLRAKIASSDGEPAAGERADLEGDVAGKITLGRKIQAEAEVAVFRLRCREPLRRLVRRRPREATASLGHPARTGDALRAAVKEALPAVERFLAEARATREELSALESSRPAHADAADPDDPLARAQREVAAIESAYAAVLRRLEVVALRLDADAGLRQVASAAGALAPSAEMAGLDEAELDQLLGEVARADAALSIGLPGDVEAHTVSEALARSAAALVRNDGSSMDELLRAMDDID